MRLLVNVLLFCLSTPGSFSSFRKQKAVLDNNSMAWAGEDDITGEKLVFIINQYYQSSHADSWDCIFILNQFIFGLSINVSMCMAANKIPAGRLPKAKPQKKMGL